MIEIACRCGNGLSRAESDVNAPAPCPKCDATIAFVCAEALPDGAGLGDFDLALIVEQGPHRVGEQLALGGVAEIEIGKLEGKHVRLPGTKVSRNHCTLRRIDFGPSRWSIHDGGSTNGLFVNGRRVIEQELKPGDRVTIGEYELVARDASPAVPQAAPIAKVATVPCKRCGALLTKPAKFCVSCGTDQRSGERHVISKDIDENAVHARAENTMQIISWLMWIGLLPIASEAFGGKKPITTWVITGLTAICSVAFMIAMNSGNEDDEAYAGPSAGVQNLMLWSGSEKASIAESRDQVDPLLRRAIQEQHPKMTPAQVDLELKAMHDKTDAAVAERSDGEVGFRWYQLITHAFLHDASSWIGLILHFGGNLLFLFVFGSRVNELIGQWRFAVSYLALAVAAGLTHHFASANDPMMPMLGASGAIMGLAGMYLILFPRQKVYMMFWLRLGLLTGFRRISHVWKMSGFWLLIAWVAWNDLLPIALATAFHLRGGGGGVAHWAHLGGFVAGVLLASLWLITRQVHAHGADLFSTVLGPRVGNVIRQG